MFRHALWSSIAANGEFSDQNMTFTMSAVRVHSIPTVYVRTMFPHAAWCDVVSISSRFTAGPRPMDVYMKAYGPRVIMGIFFAGIIWWTSQFGKGGEFPIYYYVILIAIFLMHQVREPLASM
jgi:hypothetical protein